MRHGLRPLTNHGEVRFPVARLPIRLETNFGLASSFAKVDFKRPCFAESQEVTPFYYTI